MLYYFWRNFCSENLNSDSYIRNDIKNESESLDNMQFVEKSVNHGGQTDRQIY